MWLPGRRDEAAVVVGDGQVVRDQPGHRAAVRGRRADQLGDQAGGAERAGGVVDQHERDGGRPDRRLEVAQCALLRAVAGGAAVHELDGHRRAGELLVERLLGQLLVALADDEHEPAQPRDRRHRAQRHPDRRPSRYRQVGLVAALADPDPGPAGEHDGGDPVVDATVHCSTVAAGGAPGHGFAPRWCDPGAVADPLRRGR